MPPSPQVLLSIPPNNFLVAGLPSLLRTAHAVKELSPKIILEGASPSFLGRWKRQLKGLNGLLKQELNAEDPLLIISSDGFCDAPSIRAFHDEAASSGAARRWVAEGQTVATYYPRSQARLEGKPVPACQNQKLKWWPASDAATAGQTERALYARLPQDSDGYLARFDRSISMALSKRLLWTPVTPNMITTASLLIGLLGSWMLAYGSYPAQIAGAVLLWSCCILDGCDGEVARLKLLSSPQGALYDIIADNVVHVAIFIAIPINIHRANPSASFLLPGALLVSGLLACMFSVWWLVLKKPKEERGEAGLIIERVASRDFIYLIVFLVIIQRLEWFLWAAAVGSHIFNLALWWLFRKRPTS